MSKLFIDKDLQNLFEEKGYVKIPFLSENRVNDLTSYYNRISKNEKKREGFHISLDNPDINYVKETSAYIQSILEPEILPVLEDGKIFTASFTIKEQGRQYIVPPHQDWTFVDEDKFCSATVWVPLQDVNINNGALGVIPGTHKIFRHPRSSPSPQSKSPLTDHVSTLFSFVDIIQMKAGEALIFNNALIHASPPNVSDSIRLAVGIGITQKKAKLIHYYQSPKSQISTLEKYEVDPEFFIEYNNPKLSSMYKEGLTLKSYEKIQEVERSVQEYSAESITKLVTSLSGIKRNEELSNKLSILLNPNTMTTETPKQPQDKNENSPSQKTEFNDTRTFFQKYTIPNIIAEIRYRLSKKN